MDVSAHLPLSPKEFHLLLALSERPQNGYQISQIAEENSRGLVRMSPATQYTVLHRLVGQRFVTEVTRDVDDRPAGRGQRYWSLTALGRAVLGAEARRMAADAGLVAGLGGDGAA